MIHKLQQIVEVLMSAPKQTIVTQQIAEVGVQAFVGNVNVRSTQQLVEILLTLPTPVVTQQVAEVAGQCPADLIPVRSTQQVTEILLNIPPGVVTSTQATSVTG